MIEVTAVIATSVWGGFAETSAYICTTPWPLLQTQRFYAGHWTGNCTSVVLDTAVEQGLAELANPWLNTWLWHNEANDKERGDAWRALH